MLVMWRRYLYTPIRSIQGIYHRKEGSWILVKSEVREEIPFLNLSILAYY